MSIKKEPLNKFIRRDGDEMFELFYGLMKGTIDVSTLDEEYKIIWMCIKNERNNHSGECYHIYRLLERTKKNKTDETIADMYELIMRAMCKKIFFYGIKLGYILQERFDGKG